MKNYALCPDCLRHAILAYFGEPSPTRCEACSNCLHEYETVEISESVHTILGAIKSVRQKFGATLVLSLVKGSRSQKIEQYHLDQSAFYGNLSGFTMRQLQDILRFMVQDGLVETTNDTYRLLKITPKGNAFFKQPASLTMRQYKKAEAAQAAADDVFEGLRAIRTRLSKKIPGAALRDFQRPHVARNGFRPSAKQSRNAGDQRGGRSQIQKIRPLLCRFFPKRVVKAVSSSI